SDGSPASGGDYLGRIDVDAADDAISACLEHGVGEAATLGKIFSVPFQVAQILLKGHLLRPGPAIESWRRPNVVDAGRPGSIIGLVVLWPERLQPESVIDQPERHLEVLWDE